MHLAREVDFACINMDLIAGLPQDSVEGFRRLSGGGAGPGAGEHHRPHPGHEKGLQADGGAGARFPPVRRRTECWTSAWRPCEGAGYRPYYLYRQKYMSGALENVGWCLPGTENHYNIIMMEELQSVLSLGAGGVTKLVDRSSGRIVRLTNPKYPHDYLAMSAKVLEQKDEILRFYREV